MSFGAFIFRDIIQYIMPTVLAISLFLPYFGSGKFAAKDLIETVVFLGILIGYLISTPAGEVATRVYKVLPFTKKEIANHKEMSDWMDSNWDYGKFFYNMPNEDREYVYSTSAYMSFYQLTSFYFFLYACLNILVLAIALFLSPVSQWTTVVSELRTPLLFNYSIPIWIPVLAAPMLFRALFSYFLLEYRVLFFPGLLHDQFARRYHRDGLQIAKSVWGKIVSACDGKVSGIVVELAINGKAQKTLMTTTNEKGFFQFKDAFDKCKNKSCIIRVLAGDTIKVQEVFIHGRTVPCFEIRID